MSSRLATRMLALALIVSSSAASAQAVLGPGDDALVLPRGVMRVRVLSQWTTFNERYGTGTPGRPDGALEPLAIDFNLDTIGITQFPNLRNVQTGVQGLSGDPTFQLSLGKTVVNSSVSVIATPIVFEMGVTPRLSMGLVVPYVRTRNSIFFATNPDAREGNVGFNPLITGSTAAVAQNVALRNQFTANIAAVSAKYASCQTNPAGFACGAVLASAPAIIDNATRLRDGVVGLYGVDTSTVFSPFVPITGTDAALAIDARIAALSALMTTTIPTGPTTTSPIYPGATTITARPAASPARLGLDDAQRVLTDPLFGVSADPLQTVERSHIGDIEFGAKFLLWDTFMNSGGNRMEPSGINYRASVGAVFRAGTGQADLPQNFVDVGTGNEGQNDFEVRGFADVLIGKHFWTSFIARYNFQLSDDEDVRISDFPSQRLTAAYRERNVQRNLGDISEIEINPRWVFNDYFGVMGHYFYRLKRPDEYEGTFSVDAATTGYSAITLNAGTLSQESLIEEHRLGGGISFSTIGAFNRGKAKLPLEITYLHFQTTRGYGGNAPKLFSDQIQVRLYGRIFGK